MDDNYFVHLIISKKKELIFETLHPFGYNMYDILCYGNVSFHDCYTMMEMKKISFNKKTKRLLLLKKFCYDISNKIIYYL